MDKFNAAFESELKISVTSIPMMLYCGYKVHREKGSFSRLVEVINEFLNGYDTNEEYKSYVQSGTSGAESVKARLNYWKNLIK